MTTRQAAKRREEGNLFAAALTRGPIEVLDFFLPLWAGSALGASPTQVGLLIAVETLTSFVVRPFAGVLADRFDRGRVAAVGALLYALSFAGYVVADGLAVAYPAAFLGGAGGALFWVALRARVGEGLGDDSAAYAKLFSAEGAGTWIAFVAAMSLVSQIDYRGVYAVAGVACLVAGVVLVLPDGMAAVERQHMPGLREVGRKMRPLLALVAVTAMAETGIALLLLLHLQRGHHLQLGEIAAVFLPGFIVYTVLPEYLHRFVVRLGRSRVLGIALLASAGFAVVLSFAPNPWVIAGLWILSAAAYAVAIPTEQSVVAEAAGLSLGRGMGIYESATLLGATVGAAAAGILYEGGSGWRIACLAAAGLLLTAALLVRPAVRAVGVAERPTEPEELLVEELLADDNQITESTAAKNRRDIKRWAEHLGLLVIGQAALAIFGHSFPVDAVSNGIPPGVDWWNWLFGNAREHTTWLMNWSRIWCFVFLIDTVWTWAVVVRRRSKQAARSHTGSAGPGPDQGRS